MKIKSGKHSLKKTGNENTQKRYSKSAKYRLNKKSDKVFIRVVVTIFCLNHDSPDFRLFRIIIMVILGS